MKKIISYLAILFFTSVTCLAQQNRNAITSINWTEPITVFNNQKLHFTGSFYKSNDGLPWFSSSIDIPDDGFNYSVKITNPGFSPLSESNLISDNSYLEPYIKVTSQISYHKKQASLYYEFVPLIKNTTTGLIEKLVSYKIELVKENDRRKANAARVYATSSVLSAGDWYKIGVTTEGLYKMTYAFLKFYLKMDIDNSSPADFRLFGNGGGMVPQLNSISRIDDLAENAIYVYDGGVLGKFDSPDYVLFYGQSPTKWAFNANSLKYKHTNHLYCDTTFYFATVSPVGSGLPKRIAQKASLSQSPTFNVNTFDDYRFHELDLRNFVKSGREFYGESFDITPTQTFSFSFPNITTDSVYIVSAFASHSPGVTSNLNVTANGQALYSESFYTGPAYNDDFAVEKIKSLAIYPSSSNIDISYSFNAASTVSSGFLNYIEINARRNLIWNQSQGSDQFFFRDSKSIGSGNIVQFNLSSPPSNLKIWNITDPTNVYEQLNNGQSGVFVANADSLNQYVAFSGSNYFTPSISGKISNQNLHALSQVDMLIITHPLFETQANRLADFHRSHDNLSVHVVNAPLIYNEYSSGAVDVSGIRDFVKMFYDRAQSPQQLPKYLLMFGDGSYDNKFRRSNNTNFLPVYESANSVSWIQSYVTDDFYALMDDNEGNCENSEKIDIGVGRLVVQNNQEAKTVVDKIISYSLPTSSTGTLCSADNSSLGDWRNVLCFIADDEDNNLHLNQSDRLADYMFNANRSYNIDKIYIDAFKQVVTPAGQTYPDVNDAISKRIAKGALLVNYVGHGGEVGWAQEGILYNDMINSWTNINRLPVFITATCEFSRWDDPVRTSSGEKILLNPNGGGIALYSTTRLVYASQNELVDCVLVRNMFNPDNAALRLGDLYVITKTSPWNLNQNTRNFSLLGDPAVKINYPNHKIETTTINSHPVIPLADTLSALSKVTISGIVKDNNGQKLTSFNGYLYPTVYDKAVNTSTLGNDGSNLIKSFMLQKNVLYKGKASVTNGDWSFTFIVPKDISYQFGQGKLSFYGENGETDAAGFYDSLIIGGSSNIVINDVDGPQINLYMNDDKFVFGGTTNDEPSIYAVVVDSTGINTVGNGVGHDITAILDSKTQPVYVLNDYYQADLDSYTSGKIVYPLSKLPDGRHSLKVKVWDILNNSNESYTEFVVASSSSMALDHVLNYPNPFTTHTTFSFEHNKCCQYLDAQIQIYTVSGRLIKTLYKNIYNTGTRSDDFEWDGRDDFGNSIGKGVYIYRVKISSPDGLSASKTEKLVILK